MRTLLFLCSLFILSLPVFAQKDVQDNAAPFDQLASHFDYPRRTPLDFTELGVEMKGKIMLVDLQYDGLDDHVPAWLVVPHGDGPFPAIIWGHWMMQGSPLRDRNEFLDEALVLARSGVMSLLIDTPMVRPGYQEKSVKEDPYEWAVQSDEDERQMIVDLRRGVDLLLSRPHVDRHHIAYVGHSFDAHAGAILAGVEKRITSFVLMAGSYADQQMVRNAKDGDIAKWKTQLGPDKVEEYFREYSWDDPANFIGHTQNDAIFLQFATGDHVTEADAQRMLAMFNAPDKKAKLYQASHALNGEARLDRDRWLQQHLKIKHIDEEALKAIPQLK
jgi:dienelactone hydrolase